MGLTTATGVTKNSLVNTSLQAILKIEQIAYKRNLSAVVRNNFVSIMENIKVVVVGDGAVGKSSLLISWTVMLYLRKPLVLYIVKRGATVD